MKQHKRKLALLAAAILACSAAGCAGTQDQSSAQSQSQLWVVDNSVDVQQDYVMENPSAIGDLTTPVRVISKEEQAASQRAEQPDEVRAIWLSYLDLKPMLLNSDDSSVGQEQFTKNIEQAFDNVKALGLNTVIAQVRPFSDALYESELFPWSYLAGGEEGICLAALDLERLRAYRASEVHGNAYRRPGRYGLLTERKIEPPFVRPDYRP